MPQLFVLPSQVPLSIDGAPISGCTLTFSVSGSSTPQNTYQDILLTIAHSNPVTSDTAGAFPTIYLDPSLPNYRVVLKTMAGAVLKTWDDVPSNQNAGQQFRLKSTAPSLIFEETDASAGNQRWRIRVSGERFLIELLNDAENIATAILTLDRTGTVADTVFATTVTGTFTGTLTGMSGATTGTVTYIIIGGQCILRGLFAGTSNTTAMTLTGLPALCSPAAAASTVPVTLTDNGASIGGWGRITAGATTVTFGTGINNNASGFTGSGSKGLASGFVMSYPLI
jgi:hypothetical protein